MTYSLNITGVPADNKAGAAAIVVDDTIAVPGGFAGAAASGVATLCRNVDGTQSQYVVDAERSRPEFGLRVLRKVF